MTAAEIIGWTCAVISAVCLVTAQLIYWLDLRSLRRAGRLVAEFKDASYRLDVGAKERR